MVRCKLAPWIVRTPKETSVSTLPFYKSSSAPWAYTVLDFILAIVLLAKCIVLVFACSTFFQSLAIALNDTNNFLFNLLANCRNFILQNCIF